MGALRAALTAELAVHAFDQAMADVQAETCVFAAFFADQG